MLKVFLRDKLYKSKQIKNKSIETWIKWVLIEVQVKSRSPTEARYNSKKY